MVPDSIDTKILEVLQENARVSISELSKRVNLSLSAVSERLKKLEASGIIEQYTAILNPSAMNKELTVIMLIQMENPSKLQEFHKFIADTDEILEAHYITGEYDYALKIATANSSSLEALMNKIKAIYNVKSTQTNVILSSAKNRHSVAPVAGK